MKKLSPRLLLHTCCGPCSTTALERLFPDYEVTVFFFNPNIAPAGEYTHRRDESRRFTEKAYGNDVPFVERNPGYDFFLNAVKGLENEPEGGTRCEMCFRLRMEGTARYAKENGYSFFCTTLTLSPHKNAVLINRIGFETAEKTGSVVYLPSDFKKQDGFRRSIEIAKDYGMYRQKYCGCLFSVEHLK